MQIFKESQLDIPVQNLVPAKDKLKMSIVMDVYEDLAKVKGSCDKLDIYEESMREDSPLRKVFPESYYDDTLAAKHYRVACCQKLLQVVKLGHIDGSVDHSTRGLIAVCFEPRKPAQYVKITRFKTDAQLQLYALQELRSRMMSALEVYKRNANYMGIKTSFEPAAAAIEEALEKSKDLANKL